MTARRRPLVLWLALGAAMMLGLLGRTPISKIHEQRVSETAMTMSRAGWPWAATAVAIPRVELGRRDGASRLVPVGDGSTLDVNPWLVPVFGGAIRLEKPPLPYWCTAVAYRGLGESSTAARAVPATLGIASAALIFLLARRVGGRRVAVIAVAIWASSHFVVDEYRKAMADPYLSALGLAAIVAWVEATYRARSAGRLVVLFYGALALGAIAKGPVVFLHVGVAVAAFAWCRRRRPRASWVAHAIGLACFAAIALPWPLYIVSHVPGAVEIWRFESVGEFADNQRNARPPWFYLPQLPLISAPWTAFVVGAVVTIARRRRRRDAFALIWLVALVAIFSASHMKKNAYLLPLTPALVLLAAAAVNRTIALARRRPRDARGWTVGHALAGVALAAVAVVASARADVSIATTIAVSTAACAAAAVPLWLGVRDRPADRWFAAQAFAFAVAIAALINLPPAGRPPRRAEAQPATDPPAKMRSQ